MLYLRRFTMVMACAAISLAGCGGGDSRVSPPPPAITTQILSDPGLDGDIEQTSPTTYSVTQGMSPSVQSVFAGIDPVRLTEFRAFLDFPLTGPKGVPGNAMIESAFLDVYVKTLQPNTGSLPITIDLVSFKQPMIGTDFNTTTQPALASMKVVPAFTQADIGTNVAINVTSLLVEAQRLQLADFQVRVMEDLGPTINVLMEIDDTTGVNRPLHAPQLTVTYF